MAEYYFCQRFNNNETVMAFFSTINTNVKHLTYVEKRNSQINRLCTLKAHNHLFWPNF